MGDEGEAVAGEAAARGDREPRGHALGTALPTLPRALHLDPAEVRRADLLHGGGRALPDAGEAPGDALPPPPRRPAGARGAWPGPPLPSGSARRRDRPPQDQP